MLFIVLYYSYCFYVLFRAVPVETGIERIVVLLIHAISRYAERFAEFSNLKGRRISVWLSGGYRENIIIIAILTFK